MTAFLFVPPRTVSVNSQSRVRAGAKRYFYLAGASQTPENYATVYTDAAMAATRTNPVVANSAGEFPACYVNVATKVSEYTSADVLVWTEDNIPPMGANEADIGQAIFPRTTAETTASITPTSYLYAPGDIRRYGAAGSGDDSEAFNSAIAQAKAAGGARVFVPSGRYGVNLTITGSDVQIDGEESYYDSGAGVGLYAYTPTSPVIQIGDGTITTRSIRLNNLTIYGATGNDKGLRIYGAQDVYIDGCIVRGFDEYQVQIDSSATRPTLFVYLNRCHFATVASAASLGLDFNYGSSFTTAVFMSDCIWEANASGSYVWDLAANCELRVTNTWVQGKDDKGVHLAANTARVIGQNVVIDSDASTDVLLTCDFDGRVPEVIYGAITIDGLASFTSGETAALTARQFIKDSTFILSPHIVGSLSFQDSAADLNDQHATGTLSQRITRSGNNLSVISTNGSQQHIVGTSSKFQVFKYESSTPDAPAEFGTVALLDGVTAPSAVTGMAVIYVDTADGDLKVKFADGHTVVIAADS